MAKKAGMLGDFEAKPAEALALFVPEKTIQIQHSDLRVEWLKAGKVHRLSQHDAGRLVKAKRGKIVSAAEAAKLENPKASAPAVDPAAAARAKAVDAMADKDLRKLAEELGNDEQIFEAATEEQGEALERLKDMKHKELVELVLGLEALKAPAA